MALIDPEFCESHCPVCTNARKGNRLARLVQRIEMVVTFGGCPAGRARRRKYGVAPDQPLPPEALAGRSSGTPDGAGDR
jgi:hypothetical protein